MAFPKWKYRKHPIEGYFQATLVANAKSETELGHDWSDDPVSTGFAVRQATQINAAHITEIPLFEVITDATNAPVEAVIEIILVGDISG